jgi:hypothetical protein
MVDLGEDAHQAYRFSSGVNENDLVSQAGVENRSDDELYMLEQFVGRTPPFPRGQYGYRVPDSES